MRTVGLSPCFFYPDPSRNVFGPKTLTYFENDMIRYIMGSEAKVTLLPLMDPFDSDVSAIILQGGSDVAPEAYGEKPIGKWRGDFFRDQYELKIIDWAMKNHKPILAICRGCQLLNVYFGGTLYQDIPTQLPQARIHRDVDIYDSNNHEIQIEPGGFLSRIYPSRICVNSVHHQAIKDVGFGLLVEAISTEDAVIEAISLPGKPVYGVQWHPEYSHTLGNSVADPKLLLNFFLRSDYVPSH